MVYLKEMRTSFRNLSASRSKKFKRAYWIAIATIFLGSFLFGHVQIYYDHYEGLIIGEMEPAYHLILRHSGLISGGEYSKYSDSLVPILNQLPWQFLGILVIAMVLYIITRVIRLIASILMCREKTE